MQESEQVNPSDPFLQGDIIEVVDQKGEQIAPYYGIIINADCDLAHCKIDGVISYVPIFPFSVYFENFWIPTFVESRLRELIDSIGQVCGLAFEHADDLQPGLRRRRPTEWLRN
jgi:hypothetical protein